ncbi:BY-kinase domain containing protein [Candidatus Nanopelagicaceae bacterium]
MRIVTVCRMNQARSPFAQAVLERNFPGDQISSTGIAAIQGTSILDSVLTTAKNWGVDITQSSSRALSKAMGDLLAADLVITAENSHSDVIRNLGYAGLMRSYEEILEDQDFIPIDPGGLLPDAVSRELGKVGALTLRAALDAKGYPHAHDIHVVIPHGVSDLGIALAEAQMTRIAKGAILIDADLRAPLINEIEDLGLERIFFDVDQLEVVDLPEITSQQILTHSRQLDFPEKYFLSPAWREWIQRLADKSPVVIVTAPRHSRMRRLADSYLASYMSDEFTVISA